MSKDKFRVVTTNKVEKIRERKNKLCNFCNVTTSSSNWSRHLRTEIHKKKKHILKYQLFCRRSSSSNPMIDTDYDVADYDIMDYEEPSSDDINLESTSIQQNNKDRFIESIESQNQEEEERQSSDCDAEYSSENDSDQESDYEEQNEESRNEQELSESVNSFFIDRFRAFSNNNCEESVESNEIQAFNGMIPLWEASFDGEWDKDIGRNYPFNTPQNLLLQTLVNGDDDQLSRRQLGKILFVIKLLLELKDDATGNNKDFKLPALDNLWNFQTRKRNDIPAMNTTIKTKPVKSFNALENKEEIVDREIFLNLPSEHIKLLTANPKKANTITMLPDFTPDQSLDLYQGKKWRECLSFQHPMITETGKDYWIGDVVVLKSKSLFLAESFYTKNMIRFAKGYHIFEENCCLGFSPSCTEIPSSLFSNVYKNKIQLDKYITLGSGEDEISEVHKKLITIKHPLKVNKLDTDGILKEDEYYKVKVTPVTLFSDDYSGNKSKQHNPYESWSLNFAAMPFEERTKRENTFFIWTAPKTDGVNALTVIPYIVDDLKNLEKGVLMFSAEENETVLVTAPLLFILADNPAHSNICGILGLTTVYRCRKCYYRNIKKASSQDYTVSVDYLNSSANVRTKKDYEDALDVNVIIENAVEYPVSAKNLNFRNLGSERLLDLESYNPARDTPVEILHTILLGVGKYLVNHLFTETFKGNKAKLGLLVTKLKRYEACKNYSRSFKKKIRHCGSFLSRDYKILLQILPLILSEEFNNPILDADIIQINRPLIKLAKLCSLVFVRQVETGFNQYVEDVSTTVQKLTREVHTFDVETKNLTPFPCKPKMHLLHHLPDDLMQFGCP